MTTRTIPVLIATVTSAVVLAGCGSSSNTSATSPTTGAAPAASSAAPTGATAHNPADVTFAQGMIPHHQQAVEMAKLAAQRASSAQVKELAASIQAAQQPEIDQMTGFLKSWNASVPAEGNSTGGMSGMDHGDMGNMPGAKQGSGGMPGMMSASQMQQLGKASGAEFDKMFLDMMIGHHEGAVEMSKTELSAGQNSDAKALAQRIIDAQNREITQMKTMLSK